MSRPTDPPPDAWHLKQDHAIDVSFETADAIWTAGDPVLRGFQLSAESMFYCSHLLPIVAEYPRDAAFRVLDLGCGDGRTAYAVAEMFAAAEVLGLDANARSIETCLARPRLPNLRFVSARFEELAGLGQFDTVICSEVFEHVADIEGLLRVCSESVRPGGLLLFSTPSGWIARQPRLSMLKMVLRDRQQWLLRAFPERNWRVALEHHPGSRLSVLKAMTAAAGFEIEDRRSGLATVDRGSRSTVTAFRRLLRRSDSDNSLLFALARGFGGSSQVQARRMYYLYMLLEAVMNLMPWTRILESRTFLTLRRTT